MFAAEFEGLDALRAAGVRAPQPLTHGMRDGHAYIEMERLQLGASADWPAMGRMLAALHRNTAERFGWARDNWIGLAPQVNGWTDEWARFFVEKRLRPQLARARAFDLEMPDVDKLLAGHRPKASLLHGDLWSGNVGFTPAGPVIFDPAVYYGDRETDLAMTELFGGFPDGFYASYRKEFPLEAGYETRKHLYNLYHLLNHLNLFGSGYLAQVNATLSLLRDFLQ
jgi:fructosamine-3-kinase